MIDFKTPSVEEILRQGYVWTFDGRSPEPEKHKVHRLERCGYADPEDEIGPSQTEETLCDENGNFVADVSLFGFRWHTDKAEAAKLAAKLFLKKSCDILQDLRSARMAVEDAVTERESKLPALRDRVASHGPAPKTVVPSVEEVLRKGCVFEHYDGFIRRRSVDSVCVRKVWDPKRGVLDEDTELWSDDGYEPIASLRELGFRNPSLFLSEEDALRARDAWLLASAEEALAEKEGTVKLLSERIGEMETKRRKAEKILKRAK